jgi:hypothetical protein
VRIGAPGCDGVHCYGNSTVENVVWEDVGEDALTVKGGESTNVGTVTVTGGSASHAADKVFQINAPCTFRLSNFTATNFGKVIRQNGGTTFQVIIYIDNCTFRDGDECIARSDSTSTQLYYSNMNVSNVPRLWMFPSESQINEGTSSPTDTNPPADTVAPTLDPTAVPTPEQTVIPSPTPGSGDGLKGEYYNNSDFTWPAITRIDRTISFNWGGGSPDTSIDSESFSVRWTGKVEPHFSENYTFHATTDDSVRLWVNGQQIIEQWVDQAATESSGSIYLNAGTQYDIRMEYYENSGNAVAELRWSRQNQVNEIIQGSQLFSGGLPSGNPGDANTDGAVNIVDALFIAHYYVGLNPSGFSTSNADVTGDGAMDIFDALRVARYYGGLRSGF